MRGSTRENPCDPTLHAAEYEVEDYGAYHDFIIPLARAVASARGPGVRAGLIHDVFSLSPGALQRSPSPPTSFGEDQST